jgi:hypothetical protein
VNRVVLRAVQQLGVVLVFSLLFPCVSPWSDVNPVVAGWYTSVRNVETAKGKIRNL